MSSINRLGLSIMLYAIFFGTMGHYEIGSAMYFIYSVQLLLGGGMLCWGKWRTN